VTKIDQEIMAEGGRERERERNTQW